MYVLNVLIICASNAKCYALGLGFFLFGWNDGLYMHQGCHMVAYLLGVSHRHWCQAKVRQPKGNHVFQMNEVHPSADCSQKGFKKRDRQLQARGKYESFPFLSQFSQLAPRSWISWWMWMVTLQKDVPSDLQTSSTCAASVRTKTAPVIGASRIHLGNVSFGKMEGDASDENIAYMYRMMRQMDGQTTC